MADERTQYGGQAVVEGVMMRSPHYFAVACRRLSSGEIVIEQEPVAKTILGKLTWLNKPFLRGSLALVDAMALGIKALTYAANVQANDQSPEGASEASAAGAVNLAMGEGISPPTPNSGGVRGEKLSVPAPPELGAGGANQAINGIAIGATTVLGLLIGFGLFWTLPAFITDNVPGLAHHRFWANLTEGGIRLAIFFGYIGAISQLKHVQRVFQYHGAEHKAINALEATGMPVTVAQAREASRIHPRCGTNFIFIVLITSILVFSLVPRHTFSEGVGPVAETILYRLLLLPIVAGVAYEILKFAGTHRNQAWAQAMIAPGLATQYLTTRVPDDSQIEVAIAALQSVWDKEHPAHTEPLATQFDEPAAVVA